MFVYRASGSDWFSFRICSIALLSLSAQRGLSFLPSFVLFCQLSGSSLVFGVLEFQGGVSKWDSFHSLCGACGLKTSLPLQLLKLSCIMSLIISSPPYSPFCLSGSLLIKCCFSWLSALSSLPFHSYFLFFYVG